MYMYRCVILYYLSSEIRFLGWLENEIFSASSPIWREDFNQTPEALTVPSPAGSSLTPSPSPATGPGSNSSRVGESFSLSVYFSLHMFHYTPLQLCHHSIRNMLVSCVGVEYTAPGSIKGRDITVPSPASLNRIVSSPGPMPFTSPHYIR